MIQNEWTFMTLVSSSVQGQLEPKKARLKLL